MVFYCDKYDYLNLFVSRFVLPAVIICEPLIAYYGATRWARWSSPLYHFLLLAYTGFIFGMWVSACSEQSVPVPPNEFLDWCQMGGQFFSPALKWSFLTFLLVPFLAAYPAGPLRWAIFIYFLGAFCISYGRPAFGARWCWMANGVSLLLPPLAVWEDYRSRNLQ